MSNWFNVLKESRQIADVGIKTKLGTRPLNISDDEEDCCENAFHQFKQMEGDMENYYRDLLTHSSELTNINAFRLVVASLGMDIELYDKNKVHFSGYDSKCDFFYSYLNMFWGRLGRFLIDLPTTTNNLWKRGHEIKNQLHEIMQEWEECDGEIAYPTWSKYRGEMFSELV